MTEGTSLMHFGLRVQVTMSDLPDPHIQQPTQEEGTLWYYLYGQLHGCHATRIWLNNYWLSHTLKPPWLTRAVTPHCTLIL